MRAMDRLTILKDLEEGERAERFVSLTSPRNITLMECVVAWAYVKVAFDGDAEVSENATMEDLWGLCSFDCAELANTSGLRVSEAINRFKQMKSLEFIYPDGTVNKDATILAKVYVKSKIKRF